MCSVCLLIRALRAELFDMYTVFVSIFPTKSTQGQQRANVQNVGLGTFAHHMPSILVVRSTINLGGERIRFGSILELLLTFENI